MVEALSPQALSMLIGSIYDCALAPDRWEGTLAAIRDAFAARTAILSLVDRRHGRLLLNRTVGIEPYQMEAVARHTPEINARTEEALASAGGSLDVPFRLSHHWREYMDTSPYVQECVTPYGIVDILQYFLIHTPTHYSVIAWSRHEQHGIFTAHDLEAGALLLPHLRQAVTISNILDVRTIERAQMAETLDQLRCGVVLTDAEGRMLHANRSAEDMLRRGDPIRAVGGALQARVPSAARELRSAIRIAGEDEARVGKAGLAIRLTRPEAPPVFAHVLPMNGGDLRTRLSPAAVAAVFIGAVPDERDGANAMAAAYGLTPAETRVLASLLAGHTLAETAVGLGIAATTAKSHLKNIFLKTGVSRQADLVRLSMQGIPPAAP